MEQSVLEALWAHDGPVSLTQVIERDFPTKPPSTVMTTLMRLTEKRYLIRTKQGRAFMFTPRMTRTQIDVNVAMSALTRAIDASDKPSDLRPLLASVVETVSDHGLEAKRTTID